MDKGKLFIIAIITALLILSIIGYHFGSNLMLNGPEQALIHLTNAVKERDSTSFRKHVDIASIADDATRYLVTKVPSTPLESFVPGATDVVVELSHERIVAAVEREAVRWIERGDASLTSHTGVENSVVSKFLKQHLWVQLSQCDFQRIAFVRERGKAPEAGIECAMGRYGSSAVIEVLFRDTGSLWQVAGVLNLPGFLEEINNLENARTVALNQPTEAAISETIAIDDVFARLLGITDRRIRFELSAHNLGERDISGFTARLSVFSPIGEELKSYHVSARHPIEAGGLISRQWVLDLDTLRNQDDKKIWKGRRSDWYPNASILSVRFADGEELRLVENWDEFLHIKVYED